MTLRHLRNPYFIWSPLQSTRLQLRLHLVFFYATLVWTDRQACHFWSILRRACALDNYWWCLQPCFQIKWELRLVVIFAAFTDPTYTGPKKQVWALNAVAQFRAAEFDAAIDTFIELDFNSTKVVALYPESVASRLSVPQVKHWFGNLQIVVPNSVLH
jgi:hypothetical protein